MKVETETTEDPAGGARAAAKTAAGWSETVDEFKRVKLVETMLSHTQRGEQRGRNLGAGKDKMIGEEGEEKTITG